MKRRNHLHTRHERWMVSYADLMTLLFAFFVVMYAISSVNVKKYRQIADSLDKAFQSQTSSLPSTNAVQPIAPPSPLSNSRVKQNAQWIEIEIKAKTLFQSGNAILSPQAKKELIKMAKSLLGHEQLISVEGYTDNRPIASPRYPSNWELSAARAAAVVRVLAKSGITADRLSAIGYGASHPIATNNTTQGRESNRRVVLVVARHNSIERLLDPSKRLIKRSSPIELTQTKPKPVSAKPVVNAKKEVYKEVPIVQVTRTPRGGLKFSRGKAKIKQGVVLSAEPVFSDDEILQKQ